ncbi:MAG: DUF512 domain-containing protein [Sumerlaeia bacterium]
MAVKSTPHPTDYSQLAPITPEIRRRVRRADPNDTVSPAISVAEAEPGVRLIAVAEGGLGHEAGLEPGMILRSLNGEAVRDTLDYFFHGAAERVKMEVETPGGERRTITIPKDYPEQDLGLELEQFTTQNCGCNCVFCFVHQLPDAMRKSLYIKDEDYRLSFLHGSYITGITLKDADLERIARQRLSPLYISVHAVDEELRKWLLGIRKARPVEELLGFFKRHRIQVHTQIVLCPTHNDGAQLERTLKTLLGFHPTVQSVAIVPLGMTKWRDGLPDLPPVTPAYAQRFLRDVKPIVKAAEERFGEPIVMLADEWYLIAGRAAPSYAKYPEVPQLENGVGMVYHFYKDLADARRVLAANPIGRPWRVGAVTSTLSGPVLEKIAKACADAHGEIEVVPLPTINTVFGETIHVTGLLTAQDIEKTLRANPGYDQYLLPGNCLRKYDQKFLDETTLDQLRARTGVRIDPVLGGAMDFAETILEAATDYEHERVVEHPFLAKHWSNS